MDAIKTLAAVLALSTAIFLGNCVGQPAPQSVTINLNIPVSYQFGIISPAPPNPITLTGSIPGPMAGSASATIICNYEYGFHIDATLTGGHLTATGSGGSLYTLAAPLNIQLPGGALSPLTTMVTQSYSPGDRSGTINFQQSVSSNDIAGSYSGQVNLVMTPNI